MKSIVRLDKYLADMGIGSRSDVKEKIRQGRITVNGQIVRRPETKVNTQTDAVACDTTLVGYVHYEYYMLNKPAGVISATTDRAPEESVLALDPDSGRTATVIDLIDSRCRKDLFPVGRLDKDTEGLLLITNDGALAHQLLSPKKHVSKVYYAKINGCVGEEDVKAFARGLTVDDTLTAMPARLTVLSSREPVDGIPGTSEITLEIHEGKFHQVKRMFEAVGKEVTYLKRLSMGPLVLDESLLPGEYRKLTNRELADLKNQNTPQLPEILKNIRAVIFDLDGTLIDSMWIWRDIDIEYLGRFGIPMPEDLQEAISGISVTQTAIYMKERFHIPDTTEKMIQDWNAMAWDKYCHEVPLKNGAREFLEMLKSRNIPCAIATSNSRDLTAAVLKAREIDGFFDLILTGEDVHKGKPDPDIYLEAADRLGIAPKHCLVFEDIPYGIMAAKAAGMACIAVEDAFSAVDREEKHRLADSYIHDYTDILTGKAVFTENEKNAQE